MNQEEKLKNLIQKELLIDILTEYNKNELEGKGFDFYFVLRTRLDILNKLKQ